MPFVFGSRRIILTNNSLYNSVAFSTSFTIPETETFSLLPPGKPWNAVPATIDGEAGWWEMEARKGEKRPQDVLAIRRVGWNGDYNSPRPYGTIVRESRSYIPRQNANSSGLNQWRNWWEWHAVPKNGTELEPAGPILFFNEWSSGGSANRFRIKTQTYTEDGSGNLNSVTETIVSPTNLSLVEGQRYDFTLEFRAHATDGYVKVWMDGVLIVNQVGFVGYGPDRPLYPQARVYSDDLIDDPIKQAMKVRSIVGYTPTIAAPITLAPFTNLAAAQSPNAAFTDVASDEGLILKYTGTAGTTHTLTSSTWLTEGINVTNYGIITFDFKPLTYVENIDVLGIELYSAGTPASPGANYHQIDRFGTGPGATRSILTSTTGGAAAGRRQTLGIPIANFTAAGTGADLTSIKGIRLQIRSKSASTALTMMIGPVRFQANALAASAPKAIIVFDDAHSIALTTAFPLMQPYNAPGVLMPGAIDLTMNQSGRLTTAQAKTLVDAGWQWAYQAKSTEVKATIDAMTDTQRNSEMSGQFAFAQRNLLGPYDNIGSYFSGVGPADMIAYHMFRDNLRMTRAHFLPNTGGDSLFMGEAWPPADKHLVRAIAGDASSGATMQARIDNLIAQTVTNRGVMIVDYHDNIESLAYLLDRLQVAGIAVTTFDKLPR